jgi:hypothetical protein
MPRKKSRKGHIEDKERGKENRFKMVPGPGALVQADGSYVEPQLHGGGLRRPGVPISKSPPPSALRARMRYYASEQMYHAVDILSSEDGEECGECGGSPKKASNADILKALDLLLRYGIGAKFEKFSPELVRALALSVQAEVHDTEMLKRIEARWAIVLREHVTGDVAKAG